MAYRIKGYFRYRLRDLSRNDVAMLIHDGAKATAANGKAIPKNALLSVLDKCFCVGDCGALYDGYLYAYQEYVHSGNARTHKAAKAAYNRDAYSFYPVCVHVSEIIRHGKTPCAVDM